MDSTLIGYIFGGINSSEKNIFFINDGTQSEASCQLFKVYVKKSNALSVDNLNGASTSLLNLKIYPNPNNGELNISFNLSKREDVMLSILDMKGTLIHKILLTNLMSGENIYTQDINPLAKGGVYFISFETSTEQRMQKLIIAQ
jgi:hypothetical protein